MRSSRISARKPLETNLPTHLISADLDSWEFFMLLSPKFPANSAASGAEHRAEHRFDIGQLPLWNILISSARANTVRSPSHEPAVALRRSHFHLHVTGMDRCLGSNHGGMGSPTAGSSPPKAKGPLHCRIRHSCARCGPALALRGCGSRWRDRVPGWQGCCGRSPEHGSEKPARKVPHHFLLTSSAVYSDFQSGLYQG